MSKTYEVSIWERIWKGKESEVVLVKVILCHTIEQACCYGELALDRSRNTWATFKRTA